jgi:3-oxoacyl-[acyl-carrier-protein] synthase III
MRLSPEPLVEPAAVGALATGIAGVGAALPPRVVTNAEIAERIGVDAAWIERRTGIRSRHHLDPGGTLVELAARAGAQALAEAGVAARELDVVLVATVTADQITPAAAPLVAHALGSTAAAMDVGAACTGFVSGLALASGLIESGRAGNCLLIGADVLSRHTDFGDRRTAGLFGDGAGAVVLRAGGSGWVGPVVLGSDGAAAGLIVAERDPGLVRMDGHETFKRAVAAIAAGTRAAVAAAQLTVADIDHFVFHQANGRILSAVAESLAIGDERVVDVIATLGNTSAASIPLALTHLDPAPGELVLLSAAGAGFTWGACVVEWGSA